MRVLTAMVIMVRGITVLLLITVIVSATGPTATITATRTHTTITDTDLIDITIIGLLVLVGTEVRGEAGTAAARRFRTGAEEQEAADEAVWHPEAAENRAAALEAEDGQAWAAAAGADAGRNLVCESKYSIAAADSCLEYQRPDLSAFTFRASCCPYY
jgi:hypothetical protein